MTAQPDQQHSTTKPTPRNRPPSARPGGSAAARPARVSVRGCVEPPPSATRLALVVDDEAPVRSLVATLLGRKGWRVVEAPDALSALAVARARHLDLVVTDYDMPVLSGMELTQMLRSADAELPILMISGHPDIAPRFLALPGGRVAFTAKPFGVDDFASRVEALLAGD